MTTSVWDDPDLKIGGDFIKFEDVGDTVSGTVSAVRAHRFDDGKVVPQVLLTTDDGEERTMTAGQVQLKAKLAELRPEVGDHIKVTMTGVEKRTGGKTLKVFDVDVTRGGAPATPAPAAEPAAEAAAPPVNQEALAAALGNLTPEQRKALGL